MESRKTLQQAIQFFSDFENCREFMIAVRWPTARVLCPECGSDNVTYLKNAKVYTGTTDEDAETIFRIVGLSVPEKTAYATIPPISKPVSEYDRREDLISALTVF
ncbi:MAG: transposase [Terracidiphilus sp.]